MKWYAMWHPEHGWGPRGVPILLAHKKDAVVGSALSLKKMRELGWKWVTFGSRDVGWTEVAVEKILDRYEKHIDIEPFEARVPIRAMIAGLRRALDEEGGQDEN